MVFRERMLASHNEIHVRRIGSDDWRLWRKLRLEALEEAPYAFGSTLAYWQGEADNENRWRGRLTDVPFNLIAEWQKTAAGMASGTAPNTEGAVELLSMWVAPFARGRGVGDALVHAVIEWARQQRASTVALAVFEHNARAQALYLRHGFVDAGAVANTSSRTAAERSMVRVLDPR
jgi:GNAT superfamily N-acetyltransferase